MELSRGQVAVVTGGGSGIGLALAERFARAGLDLVLADVQEDALAAAVAQVEALGVRALGVRTDVSKEAAVAMTEDLFNTMRSAGLPIGVSVLCPGWVRTNILEADRNWPSELGPKPPDDQVAAITTHHIARALAEGRTPASVADAVAD